MKILWEMSCSVKDWQNVMEICAFSANIKRYSMGLQSLHFPTFSSHCSKCQNLSREMVMKYQETVMEKSCNSFVASLWGP